jgi:hypothetical protein
MNILNNGHSKIGIIRRPHEPFRTVNVKKALTLESVYVGNTWL